MPRQRLGPFPALQGLPDISIPDPVDAPDDFEGSMDDLLERMDLINSVLATAGCNCNGHARGKQRDEFFGSDLSELVIRCAPHQVTQDGVIKTMKIDIATLKVEIDDNGELCIWQYESSEIL